MTGFSIPGEHNIGGGRIIYFRPKEDVASIPEAVSKLIEDDIEFEPGVTGFYEAYSSLDKLVFTEEEIPNDGGTSSYRYSITGFYPAAHPDFDDNFEEISQHRHVVLCEDNNGLQRLVGNTSKALRFRATWNTGERTGELRGYKYEWSGEFDERAPYYGSVPVVDDSCEPVTIEDQDGNVLDTVISGGSYQVTVFSGISDDGPPYTNNIVDNL